LLAWVVVGLLAGGIARRVVGAQKRGCISTVAIGVVGAFVGGALYRAVRGPKAKVFTGFDLWSIIVATLGAVLLLLVLNALGGRSRR
jgi:uncharacterized membrane protein YeaQ/YmgE (transglycosylase-associated protein family)